MLCSGCRFIHRRSPDALYAEIEGQFVSGQLLAAEKLARAACKRFGSDDLEQGPRFQLELAKVLLYRGHSPEAMEILQNPLPAKAAPELAVRRDILLSIAAAKLGDRDRAEVALSDADALHPTGSLQAEVLGAHGSVALQQGELDRAEHIFQSALAVLRPTNNRFLEAQMLTNLGVVALQQSHYEDSLGYFQRTSDTAQVIGARLVQVKSLCNLGWVSYQTGDFNRALQSSKNGAAEAARIGSSIDEVQCLENAGRSEFQLNNSAGARAFYERSLALAKSLRSPEQILQAHVALGYLLLRSNAVLAATHIHEATRLATTMKNGGEMLEQEFSEGLLLAAQGKTADAMVKLEDFDRQAASLPSLQWEAENTLARLYDRTGATPTADRWFRQAIDTFHRQRLSLKSVDLQLPFLENGNGLYMDYMDHLIRQHKTAQALEVIDQSRAETLAEGLKSSDAASPALPSDARSLAARLHGTILFYCLRPHASYLWAITPTEQSFYQLPGSETLLPLVANHSESILASVDLLAHKEATGRPLYDALVGPAQALIKPGSRVFLIADPELSGLNFETLIPPGDRPHYWVEDVTITNARSLRLLAARSDGQASHGAQNALLIGDPVYNQKEYPELPNAASEVTDVARHFPAGRLTVLDGPKAMPSAYGRSAPGSFSYIHFVAHATASVNSPLDSAIVLSKPPDQPYAYKLYARDILDQRLHADLVTISSCYSSGRRNYSGEGLVGLAWAFLRAGSHHVIGASWEVSDASTPQLMDLLYTGLLNGSQPDAALRAAKLAMIAGGGAFRKPLYWAPFQLYSGS